MAPMPAPAAASVFVITVHGLLSLVGLGKSVSRMGAAFTVGLLALMLRLVPRRSICGASRLYYYT